ncbi:hypothetical protein ABZ299_31660, partial [Streptomyces sp. NPDC006184]
MTARPAPAASVGPADARLPGEAVLVPAAGATRDRRPGRVRPPGGTRTPGAADCCGPPWPAA